MASFFSSDSHHGHKNVIKYDGRPFNSVEEMDNTIIENHNSVIHKDDDWYFDGDFSFNKKRTEGYLLRLNGNKFFIKGNHDGKDTIELYKKYGTYLGELAEVSINGQLIILCHYALRTWNKSHRGSWHLYGHSHHSLPDDPNSLSFDIGINGKGYNYTPLSFEQVSKIMSRKTWKSIDHHGDKE
jgi:calcineurin-like phosphoesterase family protein